MTFAIFNRKRINKVSRVRRSRSGKPGKCGIVRLYGKAKLALRWACYERDNHRCVVCQKWLPFDGSLTERMHMAHIQGTGAGGSDVLENTRTLCYGCHIVGEHNPKPCPKKVSP